MHSSEISKSIALLLKYIIIALVLASCVQFCSCNSRKVSIIGWAVDDASCKSKTNMPFVNSAEAGKVVKLLLRKETTPLETTAEEFSKLFPRVEHFAALCAAINQLQVILSSWAPGVGAGLHHHCIHY